MDDTKPRGKRGKRVIDSASAALVASMQALMTEALRRSGRTRTAIAAEIDTSLGCISRTLRKENLSLRTVARLLAASGFELRCELVEKLPLT